MVTPVPSSYRRLSLFARLRSGPRTIGNDHATLNNQRRRGNQAVAQEDGDGIGVHHVHLW